jgi:hypothetical protein
MCGVKLGVRRVVLRKALSGGEHMTRYRTVEAVAI